MNSSVFASFLDIGVDASLASDAALSQQVGLSLLREASRSRFIPPINDRGNRFSEKQSNEVLGYCSSP
jgi:hypothetical protein